MLVLGTLIGLLSSSAPVPRQAGAPGTCDLSVELR